MSEAGGRVKFGSKLRRTPGAIMSGDARVIANDNAMDRDEQEIANYKQKTIMGRARRLGRSLRAPLNDVNRHVLKPIRKAYTQFFCEHLHLHGFRDLYRSKWWPAKIFWSAAISLAFCALAYESYITVRQYEDAPLIVTPKIMFRQKRRLPDVIICPFNRFNASFFQRHNIDNDIIEYANLAFGMLTPYPFKQRMTPLPDNWKILKVRLDHILRYLNLTFEEFLHSAAYSCQDLIPYCATGHERNRDCCTSATTVALPLGVCYRVRGTEQPSAGYGFGLTIVAKVPEDKYMSRGWNQLHNAGIAVKLAEPGRGLGYDWAFVSMGTHALMPVKATKFEFDSYPGRFDCIPGTLYSPGECFDSCMFEPGEAACGCRNLISATNTVHLPVCMPHELNICFRMAVMREFQSNPYLIRNCHRRCRPACRYWDYRASLSFTTFPNSRYRYYSGGGPNHVDDKPERQVVLDLFYQQMDYTIMRHAPKMTTQILISNLGGQFLLWLGASVITLVQLLIFIVLSIYRSWKLERTRKRLWKSERTARTRRMGVVLANARWDRQEDEEDEL